MTTGLVVVETRITTFFVVVSLRSVVDDKVDCTDASVCVAVKPGPDHAK